MTKFGKRTTKGNIISTPTLDAWGKPFIPPVSSKVIGKNREHYVVHDGSRRLTLDDMKRLELELELEGQEDNPLEIEIIDVPDEFDNIGLSSDFNDTE